MNTPVRYEDEPTGLLESLEAREQTMAVEAYQSSFRDVPLPAKAVRTP